MFLSGYIGCAQTRVTWRQGDVWGFIGRGYPDTIVLKNLHSLKISGWWQRVAVTRTVHLFNLFKNGHWQNAFYFFFPNGMICWLMTVDVCFRRDKSHFELHCRPVVMPEPWFSHLWNQGLHTFPHFFLWVFANKSVRGCEVFVHQVI